MEARWYEHMLAVLVIVILLALGITMFAMAYTFGPQ